MAGLNQTDIEWVRNPGGTPGYTLNPITGCLNHVNGMCKGGGFPCYAYRLANGRLRKRYLANNNLAPTIGDGPTPYNTSRLIDSLDPFYPRFWPERILQPAKGLSAYLKTKRKGIFVCDMSDLFGIGIPEDWTRQVLEQIKVFSQHRFYLLTKQPQNLIKFSPFPPNCWVGVTATNWLAFSDALGHLATVKAKVKFLSFEPLLERIQFDMMQELLFPRVINWVIIGAQTKPYKPPKIEWVREIVEAADRAGIPVFQKNNLWGDPKQKKFRLRQEMPDDEWLKHIPDNIGALPV